MRSSGLVAYDSTRSGGYILGHGVILFSTVERNTERDRIVRMMMRHNALRCIAFDVFNAKARVARVSRRLAKILRRNVNARSTSRS